MVRIYLGHFVHWPTSPEPQQQHYWGLEIGRLFLGFAYTSDARPNPTIKALEGERD